MYVDHMNCMVNKKQLSYLLPMAKIVTFDKIINSMDISKMISDPRFSFCPNRQVKGLCLPCIAEEWY